MGLHVIKHPHAKPQAGFSILVLSNSLIQFTRAQFKFVPSYIPFPLSEQNEYFQAFQHFVPTQNAFNQRKHTTTRSAFARGLSDLFQGLIERRCKCRPIRGVCHIILPLLYRLLSNTSFRRAKKQVTEQGGKITAEFKVIKGFT